MTNENKTETYLAQTLNITAGADTYDINAKALLADKQVLSWILIVNDIRNFVFGLAKAHIYGFCKAGNRNLLCRLL